MSTYAEENEMGPGPDASFDEHMAYWGPKDLEARRREEARRYWRQNSRLFQAWLTLKALPVVVFSWHLSWKLRKAWLGIAFRGLLTGVYR